jgi:hypothetical protein
LETPCAEALITLRNMLRFRRRHKKAHQSRNHCATARSLPPFWEFAGQ